ncbi:hypothetical protein [Streptomyces hokutonensis]|uniref:hypothetical protein n=1 Tax=Streptomyces hokutonensis TaxID=1306990 RepID=UPI0036BDA349
MQLIVDEARELRREHEGAVVDRQVGMPLVAANVIVREFDGAGQGEGVEADESSRDADLRDVEDHQMGGLEFSGLEGSRAAAACAALEGGGVQPAAARDDEPAVQDEGLAESGRRRGNVRECRCGLSSSVMSVIDWRVHFIARHPGGTIAGGLPT